MAVWLTTAWRYTRVDVVAAVLLSGIVVELSSGIGEATAGTTCMPTAGSRPPTGPSRPFTDAVLSVQ